jgi:hypothetical protein
LEQELTFTRNRKNVWEIFVEYIFKIIQLYRDPKVNKHIGRRDGAEGDREGSSTSDF